MRWHSVMMGAGIVLAATGCNRGSTGTTTTTSTTTTTGAAATSGASVPAQFAGTWGADCSSPWVRFDDGSVHDFPGNADYPLKAAAFDGGNLTVTYTRPDGEVTDTYASDGATLKLTKTVAAAGGEADWDKAPMAKCP